MATVALTEDDPKEALKQYDAVLAARPKFGDAELGRAWALMRLGRLDDAEKALDGGYRLGANPRALAKQRALLAAPSSASSAKAVTSSNRLVSNGELAGWRVVNARQPSVV